jgi:hypothetical protein
MSNNLSGSYKNGRLITYKLSSLAIPPIPPIPPNPERLKLPNIHTNHKKQPLDFCVSCFIHKNNACSNNIRKNGNKVWYVLHNLVESIQTPKLTNEEFEILCTTISTVIKSLPCSECAHYSLIWYNTVIKNNAKLHNRINFIYEVWKHHDDVTKRILTIRPGAIIERLTWVEYKKQVEINKINCAHFMNII